MARDFIIQNGLSKYRTDAQTHTAAHKYNIAR